MRIAKFLVRISSLICLAWYCAIALSSCNPLSLRNHPEVTSELRTALLANPDTFNPAMSKSASNVFGFTFEGLTNQNGITGKIEPDLATSWQISSDKRRIIFTLRAGLKWSDGQPLTADDVIFTYQDVYFNSAISTTTKDGFRIGKSGQLPQVQKLDRLTVVFILPEPFAPFLSAVVSPILPAHILKESTIPDPKTGKIKFTNIWSLDTAPTEIIVNGPYQIKSYATSERIILQRNPYYWRRDRQNHPQPYIERIICQIVENHDTQLLQFRSGGLDVVDIPPENFSLLKREEKRNKFKIYNGGPDSGTSLISFNLNTGHTPEGKFVVDPIKSKWFNNIAFRQAIAYSIDRQAMINNIFRGLGKPQNSPISVQSPYYLSPEAGLTVYNHNPDQAKKLLLAAGFGYNEQKELLDQAGNRVRFSLATNAENNTRIALAAQIKQDLSEIGIQVDLNPLAFNLLINKISNTLDWECHLIGFTGGIEPNEGADIWSVNGRFHFFNQLPEPGKLSLVDREISDWERKIDELYVQGAQEFDQKKRQAIYAQSQLLTQAYLPAIYLVNSLVLVAVSDRVQGIKLSALGGALWNIYELKIIEN